MKIFPFSVTVRELTEGFTDNEEQGIRGYGGRLILMAEALRQRLQLHHWLHPFPPIAKTRTHSITSGKRNKDGRSSQRPPAVSRSIRAKESLRPADAFP